MGDWDSLDWAPQIWSTLEEPGKRARRAQILDLKKRAKEADEYVSYMCSMPSFKASDALSTITESTMQDGDEDVSDDSFERFEANVWNTALRLTIPSITATAKIATKSPAPLASREVRLGRRGARRT